MEYTSDVETCIDMIKYEMFCVKEINLVKMKSDKLIICVAFSQYCYSLTWLMVKNKDILVSCMNIKIIFIT